jgi:hypothetical protein
VACIYGTSFYKMFLLRGCALRTPRGYLQEMPLEVDKIGWSKREALAGGDRRAWKCP